MQLTKLNSMTLFVGYIRYQCAPLKGQSLTERFQYLLSVQRELFLFIGSNNRGLK